MLKAARGGVHIALFVGVLTGGIFLGARTVWADPPQPKVTAADEALLFTPAGFTQPGQVITLDAPDSPQLAIRVVDAATGKPTPCRICVVGPDGHFYQPLADSLTPFGLTGEWPKVGKGNRQDKAPFRYLGRYFYSRGESTVHVPPGRIRVEVQRGFETRPVSVTVEAAAGKPQAVTIPLERTVTSAELGYVGGDPHVHITRQTEADEQLIFDLLEAEDIRHSTILAYNEPAGPYAGFMEKLDMPQGRGLGTRSIKSRGPISILSGQEYRTSKFGHLNLFLRDELVFAGEAFNADDGPAYGVVGAETRSQGGYAFYAHGGYAQEIYADAALGTVSGVELLQFGVYRGIGLEDWYHMLNSGYRFPIEGASDFPACRFLGDCRTYVQSPGPDDITDDPAIAAWLHGMASGRSFVTTGPMLLLDVDGEQPGDVIRITGVGPSQVTVKVRVRCDVTPVTDVHLIVNGEVVHQVRIPAEKQQGAWFEISQPLSVKGSSWIAARAFSTTASGQPDAESHTNPVYVSFDGMGVYRPASLDRWLAKLDGQMAIHAARKFKGQERVLAYFQKARDQLLKVRRMGGRSINADAFTEMSRDEAANTTRTDRNLDSDGSVPDITDEELQRFLRPVPPVAAERAAQQFETAAGFRMALVASEPLVFDPVAAAFDEDGQLYVCEMRDYPYRPVAGQKGLGSIRLLRDTNDDGRFDEGHLFADDLVWAAGIAPWKGGVFVASAPDIWYLKDTDGDHRADERRIVFTGFGTENQQAMLNNLVWWLDHKIYGSTSHNGGTVRHAGRPNEPPVPVTGHDFRFRPEGEVLETITGTIQFGTTFDDWGNRFLCSESQPLYHALLPEHYLARNPFLIPPVGLVNIAPGPVQIFRISPIERWRHIRSSRRIAKNERTATSAGASHHVVDAAAGVTVYRGGAYPPEFYGNVFLADGQNNLIHRRRLVPKGVTFESQRIDAGTEIVRSPDIWFRPVNFVNAPDGTLYVLDMSREVLEAIHIPLDVVKHLDLTSGRNTGRVYRLEPPGFVRPRQPRLSQASAADLVQALTSPHVWSRETAHRLIYERQDKSIVPQLEALASSADAPHGAQLVALWSLQGLGALSDETMLAALQSPLPQLVEVMLPLAESRLSSSAELREQVLTLATRTLQSPQADKPDESTRPRLLLQIAFTLGAMEDPKAGAMLARIARDPSTDVWLRTAVLSSSSKLARPLFEALAAETSFATSPAGLEMLESLARLVGAQRSGPEVLALLERLAALSTSLGTQGAAADRWLLALCDGLKSVGQTLPPESEWPVAVRDWTGSRFKLARATLADRARPESERLAALRLVSILPREAVHDLLVECLAADQPAPLQRAAIIWLADSKSAADFARLIESWDMAVPDVRTELISALLSSELGTTAFLQAARSGHVSASAVDATRRGMLLAHRNKEISALAKEVFGSLAASPRGPVLADYRQALTLDRRVEQGRQVFEKNCTACHQLGGRGHAIGPNLASAAAKDAEALLTHILDPNQFVLPQYVQYVVLDTAGKTHAGLVTAQSATSLTLKRDQNVSETLLRSQIEELSSTGKSLMPEGLEKALTHQDMADLLGYLQSAATEAVKPDGDLKVRDFGTLPGLIEPQRQR